MTSATIATRPDNGAGAEVSRIMSEMAQLRQELERAVKLAYTLTDRLAPILVPTNTADAPNSKSPSVATGGPMVTDIQQARRQACEAADALVEIMDRLEL